MHTIRPRILSILVVLFGMALLPVAGPAEQPLSSTDEARLRSLYQQLLDGWNRGNGAAFAAVFDEQADLVGPGGFHIKGRQRIASFHQMLFDGLYKDTYLVGTVRSVRFLTDDVAIVHAVGGPRKTSDPSGTLKRRSVHTLVAVRRDGQWLLDAFQNTPI